MRTQAPAKNEFGKTFRSRRAEDEELMAGQFRHFRQGELCDAIRPSGFDLQQICDRRKGHRRKRGFQGIAAGLKRARCGRCGFLVTARMLRCGGLMRCQHDTQRAVVRGHGPCQQNNGDDRPRVISAAKHLHEVKYIPKKAAMQAGRLIQSCEAPSSRSRRTMAWMPLVRFTNWVTCRSQARLQNT